MKEPSYGVDIIVSDNAGRAISLVGDGNGMWVQVCELEGGKCLHELAMKGVVWAADLSADGKLAATGDSSTLKIWDLVEGRCLAELNGHADIITAVRFLPDGTVLTGSHDGTLRWWDLGGGICRFSLPWNVRGPTRLAIAVHVASLLAVSPLGRIYYVSGGGLYIDMNLFRRVYQQGGRDTALQPSAVSLTSDGTGALFCQNDTAEFWDLDEQRFLRSVRHEKGRILDVAITDSREGISVGDDGVVRVWDLFSGELECEISGHRDLITQVELCANGRYAVTASYDFTVRIWDVKCGKAVGCLTCEGRPHVSVPADGRHLAIVDEIGRTYLVDVTDKI